MSQAGTQDKAQNTIATKPKRPRLSNAEPPMDVMYYNQILDTLRHQQDLGLAYYGNFVYEPMSVPIESYSQWQSPIYPLALRSDSSNLVKRTKPGIQNVGGQRLGTLASGSSSMYNPALASQSVLTNQNSRNDDFPAARKAILYMQQFRSKVGPLANPEEWKQKMYDSLLKDAAKFATTEEKSGPFSEEEDAILLIVRYIYGNKWALVDKAIPGRGAPAIKKHWHSTLREKFRKTPWCAQQLAPPRDRDLNPEISGKSGMWTGVQGQGYGRDEEEDDDDHMASLQADAAELEAALQTKDPEAYSRVLHLQYLRQLAACERSTATKRVWEDVCFKCKAVGPPPIARCQWGHSPPDQQGSGPKPSTPLCFKACHPSCGMKLEGGVSQCPRHFCSTINCGLPAVRICRSCPTSYCTSHTPPAVREAEPAFQALPPGPPEFRKIICLRCQEIESKAPPLFVAHVPQYSSPLGQLYQAPAGKMRRSSVAFQDISDGEEGGEPRWVRLVEAIRPLPTNNGGPTVDKIKRAIELLKSDETMTDVREMLETSISLRVYKSNSAGATKNMALSALEIGKRRLGLPDSYRKG